MVVKEYMDGNCRVRIHDDYIVSKEETEIILKRLAAITYNEVINREERLGDDGKNNVDS